VPGECQAVGRSSEPRIANPELFSKLQSEARLEQLELKLVNNSAPRAKRVVNKIFSLQGPFINELPGGEERAGWLRIRFSDPRDL